MRELACGDSCSMSIPGRRESSAKALRWECVWRIWKNKQTNKKPDRPEWLEWNEHKEDGGVRAGGRWCGACSHFKEWVRSPCTVWSRAVSWSELTWSRIVIMKVGRSGRILDVFWRWTYEDFLRLWIWSVRERAMAACDVGGSQSVGEAWCWCGALSCPRKENKTHLECSDLAWDPLPG